jgi:hypothetical protein
MQVQTDSTGTSVTVSSASEISRLYLEGVIAGIIGAAIIAIWFLILDTFNGRPLYTPTVLGTALFGRGERLSSPESMKVSWEMTLMYTWVHGMVFVVIGGSVSYLLRLAEKNPDLGFGIILLFVVLEFGFIGAGFIFAEPILHALAWPMVLIGNLLAAAGMAGYFWLRHPKLMIRP